MVNTTRKQSRPSTISMLSPNLDPNWLHTLVHTLPDLVWLKDPEGAYLLCNQRFEQFFGAMESEIVGKTDYEFVDRELADFFRRHDLAAMRSGKPVANEEKVVFASDGHEEILETIKTPMIDESGHLVGILGIGRDITEKERLHQQLLQSQKLEAVGRLAGGVAHDYNNMLSVIVGYAEMALESVDVSDPIHDHLEEILKAGKRSTEITRQLLAFARQQTISPRVLDLNDTVETMLSMLRRLIGENIDLAWKPHGRLWPVHMDPTQLNQILANLCVNARDAISDVGKLTIETDMQTIYADDGPKPADLYPGDFVVLTVSDDGCGMDTSLIENIFEPFFTTKELGKGTGLGLSTVYGIVRQNEGFVDVSSEPGRGTTFRIYLPRASGDVGPSSSPTGTACDYGDNETVLVVEDEAQTLKLVQRMLARLGYRVLATQTPEEALRLAETRGDEITVLLTDVIMPEMNGRDLARQLRARNPELKCLYMSGYTADIIADRDLSETRGNFIQKPFTSKELADKLRKTIEAYP